MPIELPNDRAVALLRGKLRVTAPSRGEEETVSLGVVGGLLGPGDPVALEIGSWCRGSFAPSTVPLKVFVASPLGRGAFVRGDVHGDEAHDISDAIATLGCLFLGGACPPAPFPSCGSDPTPDSLECTEIGFDCP